jgi:hypothetical protein
MPRPLPVLQQIGYATPAKDTSASFRHGPDYPITRRQIELVSLERAQDEMPPLDAGQMTRHLIHFPEQRHYRRVETLMMPAKPVEVA